MPHGEGSRVPANHLKNELELFFFHSTVRDTCSAGGGLVCVHFRYEVEKIHVIDPSPGPQGFQNDRVKYHDHVCDVLLNPFFRCVTRLFENWSCDTADWQVRFPLLMTEKFTR